MEDQHLPVAIGNRRRDERGIEIQQLREPVLSHEIDDALVIVMGSGGIAVGAIGAVSVAVVGTGDEGAASA